MKQIWFEIKFTLFQYDDGSKNSGYRQFSLRFDKKIDAKDVAKKIQAIITLRKEQKLWTIEYEVMRPTRSHASDTPPRPENPELNLWEKEFVGHWAKAGGYVNSLDGAEQVIEERKPISLKHNKQS